MTEQEYLDMFKKIQKDDNTEELKPLNETPNTKNPWQSLNETPDTKQYEINENINDGWGTQAFETETRINGVSQRNNQQQYQQPRSRRPQNDPNGLNQFLPEENLNEVVQHNTIPEPTQINESVQDADIVSVEMFNKINENAMLTLAGRSTQIIQKTDTSKIINQDDRRIRNINS